MKKNKKRIVRLLIVLVLVSYTYFEMTQFAPKRLKLHIETVVSEKIPESFNDKSIAFISDIDGDVENLRKATSKLSSYNPDVVVFLGSLLNPEKQNEEANKVILELLTNINTNMGKISVLSDKDNDISKEILSSAGFTILDNQELKFYSQEAEHINFVGIGASSEEIILNELSSYTIALSYDPDKVDAMGDKTVDLMVSGKSLLGKIRLPFIGALNASTKYANRHQTVSDTDLVLTSGVSTTDPDIRLFTNPEVLIIRLKNAQ